MSLINSRFCQSLAIALLLVFTSGCTTLVSNPADPDYALARQELRDPLEPINRAIFKFNDGADKFLLKPVAKGYKAITPKPVRKGISNALSNLTEPRNIINNFLQGKFGDGIGSTYRFLTNSTIGILGLFDVASAMGVEKTPEDFGQTLGAWGVKPGPYLVLPLLGPSSLRDGTGTGIDLLGLRTNKRIADDSSVEVGLTTTNVVDTRASLLGATDLLDSQLDPYLFLRNAYQAERIRVLYDNAPPQSQKIDDFDF